MSDNGHGPDAPAPAAQIVVTMDARLGVRVQHNCPGGDVVEMLLFRALQYVGRELQAGRLMRPEEPRITIQNSFPKGL